MRDTTTFRDIFNDLFITHGGLFSKRVVRDWLDSSAKGKGHRQWKLIKQFVLDSINTHDEVSERQPVLKCLFEELKLGVDIKPLRREGDLLLRDYIVEVKQPSHLEISSIAYSTSELNDLQLLRAMKHHDKNWGILTNGAEWQFVFGGDEKEGLGVPFISFSVIDMIKNEELAEAHIDLFVSLLTNRSVRNHLLAESDRQKHLTTKSFSTCLSSIIKCASELGMAKSDLESVIQFSFRLSFIFYCEDLGILPRHSKDYSRFDVRKIFKKNKKFPVETVKYSLKAFAFQKWSRKKHDDSGNKEFWNTEIESWIDRNKQLITQLPFESICFDEKFLELDMSEISSSDLCDVYQNCITTGSDNVGTFYTSKGLSNFVNHLASSKLDFEMESGDIILDPACGSGHLLKRVLFLAPKILSKGKSFSSKADLVEKFCVEHLAGIDKNETAVFLTKMNLWLSCARPGKSLPRLSKIVQDNTLKRFEQAFSQQSNQVSSFLGNIGRRVVAVISNPPWSLIEGPTHPEKWVSDSFYWNSVKKSISAGKNNIALNFVYIAYSLLSKEGLGIFILPGVYFVGSDSNIRDFIDPYAIAYAPSSRNSDFNGVDSSQNYGIIAFRRVKNNEPVRIYFDVSTKMISDLLPEEVRFLPRFRKQNLTALSSKFATNTLLPLFSDRTEIKVLLNLIEQTSPTLGWDKGNKNGKIKGESLSQLRDSSQVSKFLATPENRGNSSQILDPVFLQESQYSNCSHKVIRFNVNDKTIAYYRGLMKFFRSKDINKIIQCLRTSKSIQSAVLNLLGIPKSTNAEFGSFYNQEESYDVAA